MDQQFLTKMWGSSAVLRWVAGAPSSLDNQQLADITMPDPAVCSIYFQSSILAGTGVVQVINLELILGLGRTTATRVVSFLNQPVPNASIDFVLPLQPLISVQARVFGLATATTPEFTVQNVIHVAPVTSVNLKGTPMRFGMAMPGEADSMDDELREELEEEAPTVAEIISNGEISDEPEPPPQATPRQLVIRSLISQFVERHGRKPTKVELKGALDRHAQRVLRRQRSGEP